MTIHDETGFVAGDFSLSLGLKPPVLGSGVRLSEDFIPASHYAASADPREYVREATSPSPNLWGTPLLHSTQQFEAFEWGKSQIGFGDSAVTFWVEWFWFEGGLFSVDGLGFTQEEVYPKPEFVWED